MGYSVYSGRHDIYTELPAVGLRAKKNVVAKRQRLLTATPPGFPSIGKNLLAYLQAFPDNNISTLKCQVFFKVYDKTVIFRTTSDC